MTERPAATQVSTRRLIVQAVLKTDVGKVRSENQDFGVLTTAQEEARSQAGGRLLIVADGMGGHRGGATASRLATETVKAHYLNTASSDVASTLHEAVTLANASVFAQSQSNPDLRGMGTTTSALVIRGNQGWFAHVGDSRIYMIRGDAIKQLTEDHSLVATMVREGLLTSQEAANHPRRNVLQRSIGVGEDVEVDVRGPMEVQENDTFILCSDGLHGLVKEEEMARIATLPLPQAANEFVKLALERGAPDNVTVIVARVVRSDQVGDDTLTDDTDRVPSVDNGMTHQQIAGVPAPILRPTQ